MRSYKEKSNYLEKNSRERYFDLSLFLILFLTFSYFYQGGFANQNSHFDLTLALAFEHSPKIDSFHTNTIDKVFYKEHFYSEKAPGSSYLALPIPLISSCWLKTKDLFKTPWFADLLFYFSTIFSVSILSASSTVAFRKILCILNDKLSVPTATGLTCSVFMGTLIFPYSTLLFGHQIAGALVVIGIYFALRPSASSAIISALSFGTAIITEYPSAVLIIPLILGIILNSKNKIKSTQYLLFSLIPLGLLLFHNYTSFGNPFILGYGKLQGTQFGAQMSQGFFGVGFPKFQRVAQLLFGSYRGLFYYCPILVFGFLSFIFWPKKLFIKQGVFFISAFIFGLLLNGSYSYWQGGVCFGPRHLIATIPLLGFGLAFIPQQWIKNPVFWIIAAVSISINLAGTATTLFLDEYDTHPLINTYWGLVKNGGLSINPIQLLTPESENWFRWNSFQNFPLASFNLGELLGLKGWFSILPLAIMWCLFVLGFYRKHKAPNR